jgi:hypothetical protein
MYTNPKIHSNARTNVFLTFAARETQSDVGQSSATVFRREVIKWKEFVLRLSPFVPVE